MAKVNISVDDDLLNRIDLHADENYMTRSGLITFAVTQYLNQCDTVKAVKSLAFSMRKIADIGEIDDETKKELNDFVLMADVLFKTSVK